MPMVWNAEADAKLLSTIIQVYDIKVSGEKLKEVAKIVGSDCTAKALTHRISKIRQMAKDGAGGVSSPDKTPGKPKATKPATPASKNGQGGNKRAASPSASSEADGEETPAKSRPKRATPKRNYAKMASGASDDGSDDEEDDQPNKKVKTEGNEDVADGLDADVGNG